MRGSRDGSFDDTLDAVVREIDAARGGAKSVRGAAREALIDRLRELDRTLVNSVRSGTDDVTLEQLSREAAAELEPFRARMPQDAYAQSRAACIDRLLRQRARLPVLALE